MKRNNNLIVLETPTQEAPSCSQFMDVVRGRRQPLIFLLHFYMLSYSILVRRLPVSGSALVLISRGRCLLLLQTQHFLCVYLLFY